jgi:transcriptional regulator with XRE-family HTH domain
MGRWEVLKLLSKALETGQDIQKISQAEIAQALGITQGRISQLFSSIGGWKSFKKLLVPLLENLKGRLINCNWRDMSFLRTTLELPLKESLPQVANQVGIGGWKDFAEIIAIASSDIQIGLIGLLLDLPNLLLLNELAAMFLPPDTRALSTSSSDNFSQDRAIFHKNR